MNINYLIFSSYLRHIHDEILTTIFILFSTWLLIIKNKEIKVSENPVSLHIRICVHVCISIQAHVYMNSYIHELLIYLCLQGFITGFVTSLWLITWLQVALIVLVPSCIIFIQAL